jgi:ABC-2 type transport system permease protein
MRGMFTLAMLFGLESTIAAGTWASQHALLLAVLWPLLISAVFLPL